MKGFVSNYPALVVALLLCLLLAGHLEARGEQKEENEICFRWAFGAMVGQKGDRRLVAITRDTVLKTGDRLKLLLQLETKCFIYLFYRTAEDDIYLLFPKTLQQFEADYKAGKKYYIPEGTKWFELDEKVGLERFYLLASAKKLMNLETLYNKYHSVDSTNKQELAKKLIAEIHQTIKQHRKFTAAAERPIAIGGNIRGIVKDENAAFPDIDPIASEVYTSNFYSKTFTIEHK
ncbi:MAG: hypothetical protein DRH90_20915 [Deltaproteobacteria bacterium]|nr:MAG: hypothetical protein DRH90_20915 [Deltaproteobacteria bacterium]RLC16219.1 MAG: hypothetical protein DRI24_08970 [Deltaproteobacteria bacterium]